MALTLNEHQCPVLEQICLVIPALPENWLSDSVLSLGGRIVIKIELFAKFAELFWKPAEAMQSNLFILFRKRRKIDAYY